MITNIKDRSAAIQRLREQVSFWQLVSTVLFAYGWILTIRILCGES